jgi:hypothetical protein
MFLFFDFFSRAFNFDAQAVQGLEARRDAQRKRSRRQ